MSVKRGRRGKAAEKKRAPRQKRRLTPHQVMTAWLALVAAGTGAWYAFAALPDANTIRNLENKLRRAETRLADNKALVADLNAQIADLSGQVAALQAEYAQFDPYLGALEPIDDYAATLAETLESAGLHLSHTDPPDAWQSVVGDYRRASFTMDVSGTYAAVTAGLEALEAKPGISVREVQIVKSGGDPDDPTLITRITLTAHVKAE